MPVSLMGRTPVHCPAFTTTRWKVVMTNKQTTNIRNLPVSTNNVTMTLRHRGQKHIERGGRERDRKRENQTLNSSLVFAQDDDQTSKRWKAIDFFSVCMCVCVWGGGAVCFFFFVKTCLPIFHHKYLGGSLTSPRFPSESYTYKQLLR